MQPGACTEQRLLNKGSAGSRALRMTAGKPAGVQTRSRGGGGKHGMMGHVKGRRRIPKTADNKWKNQNLEGSVLLPDNTGRSRNRAHSWRDISERGVDVITKSDLK